MNPYCYFLAAGCQKPSLVSTLRAHCVRPNSFQTNLSTPARGTILYGIGVRKFFGILLMVIGAAAAAYCGLIALIFSGVFLMGIIGTGGNEAVGEFFGVLVLGTIAVLISLGIFFIGKKLKGRPDIPDV